MVSDLISLGANVNEQDSSGKTPLHLCAEHGYLRVLEVNLGFVLVKNGVRAANSHPVFKITWGFLYSSALMWPHRDLGEEREFWHCQRSGITWIFCISGPEKLQEQRAVCGSGSA